MKSPVVKRSIMLAGHKTSVSLEDAFWEGLKEIASSRNMSGSALIGTIDTQRGEGNLSSAIRLFVLDHYRSRAPQQPASERPLEHGAAKTETGSATYRESAAVTQPGFRRWA